MIEDGSGSAVLATRGRAVAGRRRVWRRRRRSGSAAAAARRSRRPTARRCSTKLGEGEGEVNLIAWAGYVEDGSTDPKVDWVTRLREGDGLQGQRQGRQHLRRDGDADAHGPVRRRVGLGRRDAAPDRRRRRRAGQHRPRPELRGRLRRRSRTSRFNSVDGQMYGVPHGRGANLLMWNTDKVTAATRLAGAPSSTRTARLQGQGHGLRQPDLHRRRGAVPEGAPARPRDRRTRTSSTTSSSTPPSTCSRQQREYIGEYWSDYTKEQAAFTQGDSVVGTTWQVIANLLEAEKQGAGRDDAAQGGLDRLVGHVDDRVEGQAPELHVHVDGPHHQPEGERRRWPSGSARRRRTRSRARETADKDHCEIFHAEDEAYFDQVAFWTTPTKDCGDDRGAGLQGLLRVGRTPGRRSRAEPRADGVERPASSRRSVGRRLADRLHGRRGCSSAAAGRADRLARSSPTSGSLAVLFVAAFWQLDPFTRPDRPRVRDAELPRRSPRARSTGRSSCRTVGDRGAR